MNNFAALATWYLTVSIGARQSGSKAKSEWYFNEAQRMRRAYAAQLGVK